MLKQSSMEYAWNMLSLGITPHSSSWSLQFCTRCDFSHSSFILNLLCLPGDFQTLKPSFFSWSFMCIQVGLRGQSFQPIFVSAPLSSDFCIYLSCPSRTCLAIFEVIYSAWGLSTTLHSNSTFLCVFPSSLPHPHPPWRGNSSLWVAPYPVLSLLFQNLVLRLISPLVSSVFIACKWLSP